jgi:transcription initiation factor IIE alpha subunit
MSAEKEIVLTLLKDVKKQLEKEESAEISKNYFHPKWGDLAFVLRTVEIKDKRFEPGTIALDFSVNKCSSYLKAGKKEKIISELKELINNPKSILDDIPNYYRMLFDYP